MKRHLVFIFTLLVLPHACAVASHTGPESLSGRWEGSAAFQGERLDVVINFEQGADGLRANISLPEERLLEKRLANVSYEPPRISFELETDGGGIFFRGARDGEVISGTFSRGQLQAQLALCRVGKIREPPYAQEEVSFRNGAVTLKGTLLLPRTPGRHPGVVLIHGSSTPDRDDYRFYADLFARRGVAALIYDKRDTGGFSGGASRVDMRELAADALAAVGLLKARGDLDAGRIGLWGFSQGGWIVPIAAASSKDVAFVVSVSGPGVTYAEQNLYANAERLRARGFTDGEIREALAELARLDDYVRGNVERGEMQRSLEEAWRKRWVPETSLLRSPPDEEEIRTWVRWRNLDLDPTSYWERVRIPTLLIFGESDDAVPVGPSVERIGAALRRAGNNDVTIKVFKGAGHTIQPAPDYLETMLDWVETRAGVASGRAGRGLLK